MRIATWNMGGALIANSNKQEYDFEDLNYIIKELKKIKPEIICLQEVHISKKINQAKEIAKALGMKHFKVKQIARSHLNPDYKLAIALISKYPIASSKFLELRNPDLIFPNGRKAKSHKKGFLKTKITLENKEIMVLSGHMVPFRRFGKSLIDDDFKDIRAHIESIIIENKEPVVVGMDFNFEKEKKAIPKVVQHKFKSCITNATTPKNRKYDKIIISKEWKLSSSKIIKGKADHYLCYANIKLR